jgi:2-dehydropantoate 2-reductase
MSQSMALPEIRKLVVEIIREAFAVADKIGWRLEHTLEENVRYLESAGSHKPSMALDMDAGLYTEINSINGKICEYGVRYGVPTPYIDAIRLLIIGKEASIKNKK